MNRTEALATIKVPLALRLLMGEIAARTGEPETGVLHRLILEELVRLLQAVPTRAIRETVEEMHHA